MLRLRGVRLFRIQIIPVVLPFRLLWGGGGWGSRLLLLQGVRICVNSYHVPIQRIPIVLPFKVPGVLGFTTVGGSGCGNVSYHVPIQIRPMVLPFKLLGGCGSRLRFTSCAKTDNNNGSTF